MVQQMEQRLGSVQQVELAVELEELAEQESIWLTSREIVILPHRTSQSMNLRRACCIDLG